MNPQDQPGLPPSPDILAGRLAALFTALPEVLAVALGGSRAAARADAASDIDLYVFTRASVPLEVRRQIVVKMGGASAASLGLEYWGPGDEWLDAQTGIEIDVVYFDAGWMQEQLQRVLRDYQASQGYSTCFWHTLRQAQPLADATGWFAALQASARQPYPEQLRQNIFALNYPLLRGVIPAYAQQVEKAAWRGDLVSVNHRLAALFASYFDILFAANRVPHPGEKRLVARALETCPRLPQGFAEDVQAVLQAAGSAGVLLHLERLLDRLDNFLEQEGWNTHAAKNLTPL